MKNRWSSSRNPDGGLIAGLEVLSRVQQFPQLCQKNKQTDCGQGEKWDVCIVASQQGRDALNAMYSWNDYAIKHCLASVWVKRGKNNEKKERKKNNSLI